MRHLYQQYPTTRIISKHQRIMFFNSCLLFHYHISVYYGDIAWKFQSIFQRFGFFQGMSEFFKESLDFVYKKDMPHIQSDVLAVLQ